MEDTESWHTPPAAPQLSRPIWKSSGSDEFMEVLEKEGELEVHGERVDLGDIAKHLDSNIRRRSYFVTLAATRWN